MVPKGWEWDEPAQAHIILRLLSFHKQAEERKGRSVPETFASMIQAWRDPLDKTRRLRYADVFLYSDKLEVFYIGNNDTEKCFVGHLFIKPTIFPPLLPSRTCSHRHLSH